MKKILYIENFIADTTKYVTAADILTNSLKKEDFVVFQTSHKINKIARLFDMLWQLFQKRNQVDLILINTFSIANFYFALVCNPLVRILNIIYINILHCANLQNSLNKNSFLCRLIFKNAKNLVASSNYLKTKFEQHGYQVHFIPNSLTIKDYPFKNRTHFSVQLLWVRVFKNLTIQKWL